MKNKYPQKFLKKIKALEKEIALLKQNEEKLKEKEELFELLLSFSPIYVFFKDKNITSIALSKNYEKMLNMPLEKILGKTMDEIFPSPLAQSMIEDDKKILREEKPLTVIETLNERTYSTIKFPLRLKNGDPLLAGFTIDITEQVKAEEELKKNKDILRMAIDATPSAIAILDKELRYIVVNKYYAKIFNICPSQLEGCLVKDLMNFSYHQKHIKEIEQSLLGKVIEIEEENFSEKGEKQFFYGFYTPLYDEKKSIKGISICIADVTRLKNLEKNLKKYSQDLEEANKIKNQFFSIIAHDLRSPFQAILSLIELLLLDLSSQSKEEIGKNLSLLKEIAKNTFLFLENLLEWAKSQLNTMQSYPEEFNLYEEIKKHIDSIIHQINKKNIEVKIEVDPFLVVFVDKNLFNTVLRNFISNALKYSYHNSSIKVKGKKEENYFRVSVSDSGVGIDKENISKLFDKTQKFSTPGVDKEMGGGLGLILCKELVEKMGGNIQVESVKNQGSTFSFTFPIYSYQ